MLLKYMIVLYRDVKIVLLYELMTICSLNFIVKIALLTVRTYDNMSALTYICITLIWSSSI